MKAFVWWRWQYATSTMLGNVPRNVGSLSRQHRAHPDALGYTWCGAICKQGAQYGIAEVYHSEAVSDDVEPCEECAKLSKPIRVHRLSVEVAA